MLILSVMGVISMSRKIFSTLVGMEFRSHYFDDESRKYFLISLKVFHFGFDFSFFALLQYLVLYTHICNKSFQFNVKHISINGDFTDVNSGRAGGGILRRMLFIKVMRIV